MPSTPPAAIFSPRPAPRRTRLRTTPSRRCRKAPTRRSRRCCCRRRACRRIPPRADLLHVRNDHANVQFRINGVMLPDGVTGFGSILDPSLIGSISLITGALPAEFGMRTVGLIDITTRNDIFNNSGSISYYGGSRGTIQPSFEYGGTFGNTCPSTAPAAADSSASPITTKATQSSSAPTASRRAVPFHRPLPANHRGHRKSAALAQCNSRSLEPIQRLRLHVGIRRPGDAREPDRRHCHQLVPDSGRPRSAGRIERKSTGQQRLRHHQFQLGGAQRKPVRGHPVRRAGAAALDQRLRRASVVFHPL